VFLLKDKVDEYIDKSGVFFAGPPLFIPNLDVHMRGMPPQTTTTLAGVSGVGKSALAIRVASSLMRYANLPPDYAILYCLNEMGPQLFIDRIVSWLTRIPGRFVMTGDYREAEIYLRNEVTGLLQKHRLNEEDALGMVQQAYSELRKWNLAIAHSSTMTTFDIEDWIKDLTSLGYKVPLVIIDYVGRLIDQPATESASSVQDYISGRLVSIAQNNNTHVLSIKDFNRAGEMAQGMPPLHSLRGSTRIRYDADYIIFMSSPTLTRMTQDGEMHGMSGSVNVDFFLVKSRNAGIVGKAGSYRFYSEAGFFDIEYSSLTDKYKEWRNCLHEDDGDNERFSEASGLSEWSEAE